MDYPMVLSEDTGLLSNFLCSSQEILKCATNGNIIQVYLGSNQYDIQFLGLFGEALNKHSLPPWESNW